MDLTLKAIQKGTKGDDGSFYYDVGKVVGLNKLGVETTKVVVHVNDVVNTIRSIYPV